MPTRQSPNVCEIALPQLKLFFAMTLFVVFFFFGATMCFAQEPKILEYNKEKKTIKVELEGKKYELSVPDESDLKTESTSSEIPEKVSLQDEKASTLSGNASVKKKLYAQPPPATTVASRLYNIPTDALLSRKGFRFDFTHRFSGPIDNSTANDVYGLDSYAYSGIGLYYGILNNLEAHLFRSSLTDASEFGLKYQVFKEARKFGDGAPFGLTISTGFQNDNIQNSIDPYVQGIFTKVVIPKWLKIYLVPTYANKSATIGTDNSLSASFFTFNDPKKRGFKRTSGTFGLPIGAALSLVPSGRFALFGEYSPVLSGYKEVKDGWAFGLQILSRLETHVWTIGISNVPYSTFGQFIVGGPSNNWHLGFNVSARIK